MRWIVLAISLVASTMSIMHGILIILQIFNPDPNDAGIVGMWSSSFIPKAVLNSLPIVSAFIALVGGVISFSGGRIGAFFLLTATVLCAFAPRDIWLYGALYFLAAILCFFIKPRQEQSDYYDYDLEDFENLNLSDDEEAEYENNINRRSGANGAYDDENSYNSYRSGARRSGRYDNNYADERGNLRYNQNTQINQNSQSQNQQYTENYANNANQGAVLNYTNIADGRPDSNDNILETAGIVRRRAFKTCPKCGENVNPEARLCPTCGEPLHVPEYAVRSSEAAADTSKAQNLILNNNAGADTHEKINVNNVNGVNGASINHGKEINNTTEFKTESRDDDMQAVVQMGSGAAHRVFVKPRHEDIDVPRRPVNLDINPDKSYQEFGQYARRRKRGKSRSFGRRVFSFLLLFAVAGGALWFLLGLRKLPQDEIPTLIRETVTREERRESDDVLVQPVGPELVATVESTQNDLPAFTPDRNPKQAIITRPGVNLREDHTTSSRSLAKLSANTQAELLERWGGSGSGKTPGPWYKVRTGGRDGWVYGDYVQQRGGSLPSGYSRALLKTFGSDKAALTSNFGTPRNSNNTTMEWSGVTATFRNNNLVRLRLNPGSQYELKNGLKPGISRDDLLNIMGYPSSISQRNYVYSENGKTGVSVEVRNNAVSSVTVNDVQ